MGILLEFWDNLWINCKREKASDKLIDNTKVNVKVDEYKGVKKANEKIRLYLYGKNLLTIFKLEIIKKYNLIKKSIKNIEYLSLEDDQSNIEYLIFDELISEEINKAISSMMEKNYLKSQFYDIIVVSVNSLRDEQTKIFINHFQSFTLKMIKQPFYLFLTSENNPKIKDLYEQISNHYFDKRNLTAMKFPDNDEFPKIISYISEKISYYNGYGDLYDKSDLSAEYLFNILICGLAGVGKSSFINILEHSKRSKEGEGNSITDSIIRFTHPLYPLGIYDTPGFENKETVMKVKELLEKYNKILKDERKKINLILYFLPYNDRIILEMEKIILNYIVHLDCEIIFVINKVKDDIESDDFLKYMENFKDVINNSYESMIKINVIPVNLYPTYKNGKVVNKAFGLDKLFNKIYQIFKDEIIDMKEIDKITSVPQLFNFLNENKMYNQFKNKNDFVLTLKASAFKIILKYSKSILTRYNKESDIQKMIKEIYNLFYDDKVEEKTFINSILEKKFEEDEKEQLCDDFYNNSFVLKNMDKLSDFSFFKSLQNKDIICIGNYCMKTLESRFKNDPNLFIIDNKPNLKIIKRCCESLNKAINSFEQLSKEFHDIYEELYNKKNEEKIKTPSIEIETIGHKSDYFPIDNNKSNILENNKIHELNIKVNDNNEKISNEEEEKLNIIDKNDNIINTNKIDSSENTIKWWESFF